MSEIIRIIDQFEREHDGDPWHGSPLSAILDGVTAVAVPLGSAATVTGTVSVVVNGLRQSRALHAWKVTSIGSASFPRAPRAAVTGTVIATLSA